MSDLTWSGVFPSKPGWYWTRSNVRSTNPEYEELGMVRIVRCQAPDGTAYLTWEEPPRSSPFRPIQYAGPIPRPKPETFAAVESRREMDRAPLPAPGAES